MHWKFGFLGFFKGNFVSTLGVVPWVAINMTTFDYMKHKLTPTPLGVNYCNAISGATSGAISMMVVYPLDLIRRRL